MDHIVHTAWGDKTIRVICGELRDIDMQVDLLVCSAFKNDYIPTRTSLIGALYWNYGISVEALAAMPALNLKDLGVWVSGPVECAKFGRIACVEILQHFGQSVTEDELRGLYDTLFFAVKKCRMMGRPVRSMAMHILGTGDQGITLEKSLVPLLTECMSALRTLEELDMVILFDRREERCSRISEAIREKDPETGSDMAFISYSHKDLEIANLIANSLEENGIKPWIDHKMIRNADYAEDIVRGITESRAFLLLVSPYSMRSPDCLREVRNASAAADTGSLKILPVKLENVAYPANFSYYLAGLDYTDISEPPQEEKARMLCRTLRSKLNG